MTLNEIAEKVTKCKTRKQSIKIAGELVALILFNEKNNIYTFNLINLQDKFGDEVVKNLEKLTNKEG